MHASLLGFCLESLIIDNDIIGAAQRTIRGIEVNDETLSLETIRKVCLEGPGHYLGSDQTLRLMQRDYVYPTVGDRTSPKEWVERGSTNIVQKAMKQVKLILDRNYPRHVPDAVDDADPRQAAGAPAARGDAAEGLSGLPATPLPLTVMVGLGPTIHEFRWASRRGGRQTRGWSCQARP